LCEVEYFDWDIEEWVGLGETEFAEEKLSHQFEKKIDWNLNLHRKIELRVKVYDVSDKS
jgi:hypothetical protein